MALPAGPTSVLATQGIFIGLAWIFVLTRLYCRSFIVKKLDWDDFTLTLTLGLYTCFASFICTVASVHEFQYGISPFNLTVTLEGLGRGAHYWFLSETFYSTPFPLSRLTHRLTPEVVTAGTLRLSVALLLLRIAHTRAQKVTIWATVTLMLITSIIFFFITVFQCIPVSYYWNYSPLATGKCNRHTVLANIGYAHMAVSFVADWTLGLLPIWLLWKVQISRKRKAVVALLLGCGLLAGVAALVRIPFIRELLYTENFQADWVGLALWFVPSFCHLPVFKLEWEIYSIIEPGLGLIAASLAALRPFFASVGWHALSSKLSARRLLSLSSSRKASTEKSVGEDAKREMGRIHVKTTVRRHEEWDPDMPGADDVPERRNSGDP
jgi:hypothetical protein